MSTFEIKDGDHEGFREMVRLMRYAQTQYFKTRSKTALGNAKALEKSIDVYLKQPRSCS